jgi:hypothetical protein
VRRVRFEADGTESDEPVTRARKFFRPPFRFENGYIWDSNGEMVADDRIDQPEDASSVLRARGWGRMKYEPESEQLYDEVGTELAAALTRGWVKP